MLNVDRADIRHVKQSANEPLDVEKDNAREQKKCRDEAVNCKANDEGSLVPPSVKHDPDAERREDLRELEQKKQKSDLR